VGGKDPRDETPACGREREQHFAAALLAGAAPLASLLVLGTPTVAIAKVHGPKGFFVQNGGYEYNLVLIIAALTLALVGPGAFSLDHLLGLAR